MEPSSRDKPEENKLTVRMNSFLIKVRRKLHTVFFLIPFLFTQVGHSQNDWVLEKQKNGIAVFGLKADSSKFKSIKVETELSGTIKNLISILLDVENHHAWAYGTKSAYILKRISESEIILYKEIEVPNPMSNRDMIVKLKIIHEQEANSLLVEATALPDFMPERKGIVRVQVSNEKWTVTAQKDQKIRITYYLQIDPGGKLPPVIVNMFSSKGPFETFERLRTRLAASGKSIN